MGWCLTDIGILLQVLQPGHTADSFAAFSPHTIVLVAGVYAQTLRFAVPLDTLYYVISGTSQILQLTSLDSADEHFVYSN